MKELLLPYSHLKQRMPIDQEVSQLKQESGKFLRKPDMWLETKPVLCKLDYLLVWADFQTILETYKFIFKQIPRLLLVFLKNLNEANNNKTEQYI